MNGLWTKYGLSLAPLAANPGGVDTLWINSTDSNRLYLGASPIDILGSGGGTAGSQEADFAGLKSVTWTTHQHNFTDIDYDTITGWRVNLAGADRDLTGLVPPGPGQSTIKLFFNVNTTKKIKIRHLDGNSLVANQILCPDETDFDLHQYSSLYVRYDTTLAKWTLIGWKR